MSGSWTERGFRPPDEGTELKADKSVLDVAAWREKNDWGQGGTKEVILLLRELLAEQKLTNQILMEAYDV